MKYNVVFKDGAVCLPSSAFLLCDDILEFKFLMLLSYDRALSDADDSVLAEDLGCSIPELHRVIEALKKKGLMEGEKKLAPSQSAKNLSGEEMSEIIDSDNSFKALIEECSALCGKVFTPTDISKIVSLKTSLGLDCETILLHFFYNYEKLSAVGKKLTVSYVEKAAYTLYNQGIKTSEALQSHIKECERRNSNKYRLSRLFGIGDRAFTKKEKAFFEKWLNEWEMTFELIEAAYEINIDNTGKISYEYISKILSDWHGSGITTVEQAEKASEDFKNSRKTKSSFTEKPAENNGESFNTEEFFEKALKRSYAIMSSQGSGDGGN